MFRDGFEDEAFDPRFDRSPSPGCRKNQAPENADVLKGIVKDIKSFGAFVSVPGHDRHGLLHISQISSERVEKVEEVLSIGQEVWVKVAKHDGEKFSLTMKYISQVDGTVQESSKGKFFSKEGIGAADGFKTPVINEVYHGFVKRIQPFGAFISFDGFDRDGLLHISCVSRNKIEAVEDVLSVGDKVWVKVTKVDTDGKYALDMRDINQRNGSDNDPSNLNKGKGYRNDQSNNREAISLDAIYNTNCSRCGGLGHLPHECFNKAGTKYEMLKDDVLPEKTLISLKMQSRHTLANNDTKRLEKKSKKKHKRKLASMSSEEDGCSKKKKHKKHKKH